MQINTHKYLFNLYEFIRSYFELDLDIKNKNANMLKLNVLKGRDKLCQYLKIKHY